MHEDAELTAILHDLRELRAREDIRELRALYGWHAARGDFDRIADLFTHDGVFELTRQGERHRLEGREAIREFLGRMMVPAMVFPMIHNDIVRVDGDRAHGTCAMDSRTADGKVAFSGYYHDEARLLDGQWKFSRRSHYFYIPRFERSGLDQNGDPESGLAAIHDRKIGQGAPSG